MYILISCCEGNTIVNKYATYDDAYASMEKEYSEFVADCEEKDEHGIYGYDAFVAYKLCYRIDWHIEAM